jgi:hypothetical protein
MIAAAFLIPLAAQAQTLPPQPRALHDKAWYSSHPAERDATLRICHSDASFGDLYDCLNAEAAAGLSRFSEGKNSQRRWSSSEQMLHDPEFWRQNPIARDGELIQCARRGPGDEMALPYCAAAAAAAGKRL